MFSDQAQPETLSLLPALTPFKGRSPKAAIKNKIIEIENKDFLFILVFKTCSWVVFLLILGFSKLLDFAADGINLAATGKCTISIPTVS